MWPHCLKQFLLQERSLTNLLNEWMSVQLLTNPLLKLSSIVFHPLALPWTCSYSVTVPSQTPLPPPRTPPPLAVSFPFGCLPWHPFSPFHHTPPPQGFHCPLCGNDSDILCLQLWLFPNSESLWQLLPHISTWRPPQDPRFSIFQNWNHIWAPCFS